MCRHEHELCQHDLRGLSKYEVNQHYFEFIRNATKEECGKYGYGLYKCRICGDISFHQNSSFKTKLKTCKNNCNGARRGNSSTTIIGYNDLATTHPNLTKEWHPTKNGDLTPNKVTSGSIKKVWWLDECGHEWYATINHRTNGRCCPYCSNKKVLKGFNDLATTHPHKVKYFSNIEDAYTHTYASEDRVDLVCPDCGHIKQCSICNLIQHGFSCDFCSDGISYPEKLMINILNKLDIDYSRQLTYDNGKHRYDFYIKDLKAIFETHGIQHYEQIGRKGARTLEEEQANDEYKYNDAINNGIKEEDYHQIDCRYSTLDWCRPSIEKVLSNYVDITVLTDEDWQEIDIKAQKSKKIEVCNYWKEQKEINKDLTPSQVADIFKLSSNTIISYLTWGTENELCIYNGEEEFKAKVRRHSKFIYLIKPNGIKWFNKEMSMRELERETGISRSAIVKSKEAKQPLKQGRNTKYNPKYIGSYVVDADEWDSQHN